VFNSLISELSLLPSSTNNLESYQRYLEPAPIGIDAQYAWTKVGGNGNGITIIDIEWGWNFNHEDLKENQRGVIIGNNRNDDHGTAVLGIFSGDNNGLGITGIASNAIAGAISAEYDSFNKKWNAANAIRLAADRLNPGDIILLEMHAPGPNASGAGQDGYIPVEYWQPEYLAIRYAVEQGINVVEAAGNGGENLDDPIYRNLFSRSLRDSGAILVGGGASAFQTNPRSRIWWSNYGSRLDVQGWGEDIVTAGGRSQAVYFNLIDHPQASRCYTKSFGGTSGASPIVVGVAASINGILKASGRSPLPPLEMRQLLVKTGTPQTSNSSEQIGALPDLKKALLALGI
jgi:subtilisin family serine protease